MCVNASGFAQSQPVSSLQVNVIATLALQGFVLVAPALHFWYLSLSRIVSATGTTGAISRLALDQFAFAPPFIAVFFAALLALEARSSQQTEF